MCVRVVLRVRSWTKKARVGVRSTSSWKNSGYTSAKDTKGFTMAKIESTNLKNSRPTEWFLEIDGKRIGMPTCSCRRCKTGKSHVFLTWESAVDGLRRCPYFAGLPIRIVEVDNSFPKGDGK